MKRPGILAALLVLGTAAIVALFPSGSAGEDAPIGAEPAAAELERSAAMPAEGVARPDGGATLPDFDGGEQGFDRVALEDEGAGADGLRLRLIDGVTRAPVVGAKVRVEPDPSWASWGRGRGGRGVFPGLDDLEERGVERTSGADGEVVLPAFRRQALVAAEWEGLFGASLVAADEREPVLELFVDRTVVVRVVDGVGRPEPGVEVALAVDLLQRIDERASETSDEEGLATFRHVQMMQVPRPAVDVNLAANVVDLSNQLAILEGSATNGGFTIRFGAPRPEPAAGREIRQLRDELRNAQREVYVQTARRRNSQPAGSSPAAQAQTDYADFLVYARVPQVTPSVLRFAAAVLPTGIVDLGIGSVGAMEIRLFGPDGVPLASPCSVEVRRSEASPLPGSVEPGLAASLQRTRGASADKPLGEESVLVAPVGSGSLVDVFVRFADRDFGFDKKAVEGPYGDETRVLDLVVPDWFTTVTGRLVDAQGEPLAGQSGEFLISGTKGRVEGERLVSADDGRFELPLRLREPLGPYTLEIQSSFDAEIPAGALVALPELQSGRRHEIGDVRLDALPVIVAGSVRDDRGQPVAGAYVQLQSWNPGAGANGGYSDVAYVRGQAAEDGTYRLHGAVRADRIRVVVRQRGHGAAVSDDLPFGARYDAVLVREGGILAGGFVPDWAPRGAVEIVVSRDGRAVRREGLRTGGDGRFQSRIGGLSPGRYDLSFTLRGYGDLGQPQLVDVEPGANTSALETDFRDRLFRFVVALADAAGQPQGDPGSPLLAEVVGADGRRSWTAFTWRGGRAEFFAPQRAVSVVAMGPGRAPVRADIVPGETTLTLNGLQPVEITLPGLRAMVGERRVRVSLVYEGDTGLPMSDTQAVDAVRGGSRGYPRASLGKSGGGWLGEDDRTSVPLMLDGRYQVVLRLSQNGGRGTVSREIGVIDVRLGGPEPERVVVTPPFAIVQQMVAELESR
ncbi:MAG: hypothetical protein O3C51_05730 [Planctomycetota bacterium]|nr:hypothetical protein [Planctomycetota bacterium]